MIFIYFFAVDVVINYLLIKNICQLIKTSIIHFLASQCFLIICSIFVIHIRFFNPHPTSRLFSTADVPLISLPENISTPGVPISFKLNIQLFDTPVKRKILHMCCASFIKILFHLNKSIMIHYSMMSCLRKVILTCAYHAIIVLPAILTHLHIKKCGSILRCYGKTVLKRCNKDMGYVLNYLRYFMRRYICVATCT